MAGVSSSEFVALRLNRLIEQRSQTGRSDLDYWNFWFSLVRTIARPFFLCKLTPIRSKSLSEIIFYLQKMLLKYGRFSAIDKITFWPSYDFAKIEFCEKGLWREHDLRKFQFATFAVLFDCRCLPVVAERTLVGVFLQSQVEWRVDSLFYLVVDHFYLRSSVFHF